MLPHERHGMPESVDQYTMPWFLPVASSHTSFHHVLTIVPQRIFNYVQILNLQMFTIHNSPTLITKSFLAFVTNPASKGH